MTFDFQSYLASIRTTYAKWWEYYTLTDATGKQRQSREDSPFFDFGLMVQTVKREERDQPTEEKVERFSVLDGLRKYADQQVLLVGRPGSGKSTALARLMLEEATNQQARIPVLVELRYWQGSIQQLIHNSLIRHELPAEQVEAALKNAMILFDGVNELPSEEARSQLSAFRRNHPKLPMIFTTRDLSIGGDLGIEKKLEMQPLSEDQMREFVRSYLPDQAEQMLGQLKDRLREFGQTPLLLWMLCSLFRQTGKIPENLGLVFREFTQGYERQLKDDVRIESDKAWWKPVLQQLAWVMMQGEKPTEFRVAISREEAVRAIAQFLNQKVPYAEDFARKCLRDLQRYHLIQAGTNQEELEFRHQLIQEYYAAEALLDQLPRLDDERLKREYLNFLKWTEPLALMLALVKDEVQAVQVVDLALEVDYRLGASLSGEARQRFQKQTVKLVNDLKVPNWLKAELLAITRSDCATKILLKHIEDPDPDVRSRAVEVMQWLDREKTIPTLLQLMKRSNSDIRWSATQAIQRTGSETAISGLLELIASSDADVCSSAVDALEYIENETAIPGLLKLMEHSSSDVRWSAAYLIGQIGKVIVVPKLLELMEHSDPDIRRNTAYVLGLVWNERAIQGLKKLAEDADPDVRDQAAQSLDYIERQIEPVYLSSPEEYSNPFSKGRHVEQVDNETAISDLLELAEDSNLFKRNSALKALAQIRGERAINELLKLTEHSNSAIRRIIAKALAESARDYTDAIAKHLPYFLTVVLTNIGEEAYSIISAIQANCKYYNYEIYQDYLKAQKHDRQTSQNSDRSSPTIYQFPNVTEAKIFENVDRYYETPPKDPPS